MPDPGAIRPKRARLRKEDRRTLREARKRTEKGIFERENIKRLQAEVDRIDKDVNKAQREVKKAQRKLKKTPKPSKTVLQRIFGNVRGGGGGGGVGGFEFDKVSGKLRRRRILQ